MAIICNSYANSADFTWNKETRTFVAEASDLDHAGPSRVYDDACDEGFFMVSEVTGNKVLMILSEVEKDREGDIMGWRFQAYDKFGQKRLDFGALIIND